MPARKTSRSTNSLATMWWSNVFKTWEIAMAAPQVIAHRTARMVAAGANPNARDRKEFNRMGQEKIDAFGESLINMSLPLFKMNQELAQIAMRQWWKAWAAPAMMAGASPAKIKRAHAALISSLVAPMTSKRTNHLLSSAVGEGLAPVHRRVTANAKRLQP